MPERRVSNAQRAMRPGKPIRSVANEADAATIFGVLVQLLWHLPRFRDSILAAQVRLHLCQLCMLVVQHHSQHGLRSPVMWCFLNSRKCWMLWGEATHMYPCPRETWVLRQ